MAIPSTTAPPSPPSSSLLATLTRFRQLQITRASLSHELDSALSTYLIASKSTPAPVLPSPIEGVAPSTCLQEAFAPPSQAELGEVLRIGFEGLMEVRGEMLSLAGELEHAWRRKDLAGVVEKVEDAEGERLKVTFERDQLRRLAMLEEDGDFTDQIAQLEAKRQSLAESINEESQEIAAEIAQLTADQDEP